MILHRSIKAKVIWDKRGKISNNQTLQGEGGALEKSGQGCRQKYP